MNLSQLVMFATSLLLQLRAKQLQHELETAEAERQKLLAEQQATAKLAVEEFPIPGEQPLQMPEGFRPEAKELGMTPEQLIGDTFDQARKAEELWEGYVAEAPQALRSRMEVLRDRVKAAARKLKQALMVGMIGV